MKRFKATARASGPEITNFATKILQAQFGATNVIGIPTQIGNG